MFADTLTADDKYAVPEIENLQFPIQMRLPLKHDTFSQFLLQFMESTLNFKHFQRKEDRHS